MSAERLGPFLLRQPPGVFPLGEDALRLAAFATVRRSWKVCDLGTGSGCLLLLLSGRATGLDLYGVELDPTAARAARDNLMENGLGGTVWTGDWNTLPGGTGPFDLVVSNPPYFAQGSGASGGPARMEGRDGLVRVFLFADMDYRVKRITDLGYYEEKDVKKNIKRIDRERRDYHRYYTGRDWENVENYDLMLNTASLGTEGAVKAIREYLRIKGYEL